MSDTLIERLRFNDETAGHSLFSDAADRIEALEAQLAEPTDPAGVSEMAKELERLATFGGELGTILVAPELTARILAALRGRA